MFIARLSRLSSLGPQTRLLSTSHFQRSGNWTRTISAPVREHVQRLQGTTAIRRLSTENPLPKPPVVDGMPRYPNATAGGVLRSLDYAGTVVFAFSGALTAGARGMDVLGCSMVGTITAVGGGTVRDLLLGNRPVFWMVETEYLLLSLLTAIGTFFLWNDVSNRLKVEEDAQAILYSDALGLAAFCVIGAQNGIRCGVAPIVSVVCGVMTATFGGLIRDVLCQRPVRILHSHAEIYATTAACGAAVYVAAARTGLPLVGRIALGVASALAARVAAFTYDIKLPEFQKRE